MLILSITQNGALQNFDLDKNKTLGRPSANVTPDISINSSIVSRKHGVFILEGSNCYYEDLASSNGTLLNGSPVVPNSRVLIKAGDCLSIHAAQDNDHSRDIELRISEYQQNAQLSRSDNLLRININMCPTDPRSQWRFPVSNFNLSLEGGSINFFLGSRRFGLNTLFDACLGYEPVDGVILYNSNNIFGNNVNTDRLFKFIGYGDYYDDSITVQETVLNAASLLFSSMDEAAGYASEALKLTKAEAFSSLKVGQLSHFQRKVLALAVSCVTIPAVLIIDFDDNELSGSEVANYFTILQVIASRGSIIMISGSDPGAVQSQVDRLIVIAVSNVDNYAHIAYCGAPAQAIGFFNVTDLNMISKRILNPSEGGEGMGDRFITLFNGNLV